MVCGLNARIPAMPKTSSAKARAKKIRLLLFDVDGVLTDGKLFLFPVPTAGQSGGPASGQLVVEAKGFHAQDGAGISIARIAGIKSGLITRRNSESVALRARDLKLDQVHQGIRDKLKAFREILSAEGLTASEVAFVGDDVIDLPVMRNCGSGTRGQRRTTCSRLSGAIPCHHRTSLRSMRPLCGPRVVMKKRRRLQTSALRSRRSSGVAAKTASRLWWR